MLPGWWNGRHKGLKIPRWSNGVPVRVWFPAKKGLFLKFYKRTSKQSFFCTEKKDFVDFLQASGQSYWQLLPICPTSYGDSPYQSYSTFAGNPYFIDIDRLIEAGLIKKEYCGVKNDAAAVFLRQTHTLVITQGWGDPFRRSSDSWLLDSGNIRSALCLPGNIQWLAFAKREHHTTYSGGTVRDFHPIILFSSAGSTPELPQSSLWS